MKQATDFIAERTAEEFIQFIKKHPGKLRPSEKHELKFLEKEATRQCDIELLRLIRDYISKH